MTDFRDRLGDISFRGRLLLLLVGVSVLLAAAATFTYLDLMTKPVDQRYQAELQATVGRASAPLIDQALKEASTSLESLFANTKFQAAVNSGKESAIETQVAAAISKAGDDANFTIYVTDGEGELIAGERPDAPMIERTEAPLRRGSDLIATVHVPVVLDSAFMERAGAYSSKTLFAADSEQLFTSKGGEQRPSKLEEGFHYVKIDDKRQFAYAVPVLDGEILVGAAVPEATIAAAKDENRGRLMIFVAVLLTLMVAVSWFITRSVGQALGKFAQVTRNLATGEMHQRIPVSGRDEIAVLSTSFNDMAETLELRMQGLLDARARMRRQVEAFGEVLANTTAIDEMLLGVCSVALESTSGTHARFWMIDNDGYYQHAACIGLRQGDTEPCELEKLALREGRAVASEGAPSWIAVPARSSDGVIGVLTLVNTRESFDSDALAIAERLATQAAFAIDNARMHEKLRLQATRDGLTGLANHRSMQEKLDEYLAEARSNGMPVGVTLLDVDNFKSINDTYGHPTGDEALKAIAAVLNSTVGSLGFPARYGGEEFMVVMPGCDAAASWRIAERIREGIAMIEVPLDTGGMLTLSASFGVANIDQFPAGVEKSKLLNCADQALYVAKRGGKNRVALHGEGARQIEAPKPAAESGDDYVDIAA